MEAQKCLVRQTCSGCAYYTVHCISPFTIGTGAVDIRINVADLNRGSPNTVNLILLAAGGVLIGEVPISFSLGQ